MTSISTDHRFTYTSTPPTTNWAAAVHKKAGSVIYSSEVSEDSSSFTKLLESKVKQAKGELTKTLDRNLWGQPIKADMNEAVDKIKAEREYEKHINQNIMSESSVLEALKMKTRKADMNEAVDKIKAEREEEKARQVFDTLDGIFEDLDYTGAMVGWTVQFNVTDKEYTYGAVLAADGCWYITGRETSGRKPEDFKAFVADQVLRAHRVEFRGTVL